MAGLPTPRANRTGIEMRNPRPERNPLREKARQVLDQIELHRSELFQLSREYVEAGRTTEFRQLIANRWRAWRDSPTSLLLVGISYHLEGDHARAREFVERAEKIWADLAEFGMLDGVTNELVRSSLACCHAKILEAQGDAAGARRLIQARIREVDGQPQWQDAARNEINRRPLELLQSRQGLAPTGISELAEV